MPSPNSRLTYWVAAMVRLARRETIDPNEVVIAHVGNRTVRKCFLMGEDADSGKNFDHRKVWIEEYLRQLSRHFGVDLLCFSILSNHMHLILRTRPDVVATWSDEEVARRWMMLCPLRKNADGSPCQPTEPEIKSIAGCPVKINEIRVGIDEVEAHFVRRIRESVRSPPDGFADLSLADQRVDLVCVVTRSVTSC